MATESPVFSAVKQILHLLDLDKITPYSYRDDFSKLWELDAPMPYTKPIWCVVDDSFGQFHWLPISVWGHYYRAKLGVKAPKLVIIGDESALNPPPDRELLFIPAFYRDKEGNLIDEGLKDVAFWSKENDFITQLCSALIKLQEFQALIDLEDNKAGAEKEFGPEDQMIMGWQGIIRNTFSLPEQRHRISNEIAPIELAKAIIRLQNDVTDDNKAIISDFLKAFTFNREQKALMEIWKWVSVIDATQVNIVLENYRMKDIWNVWSSAKYLLIDDQAKSGGYDKILTCALALMTGNRSVQLECQESADDSVPYIDNILANYSCLFLDLRLTPEDQVCKKYENLTGVKIAKKIAERSPAFPVIIFSSSQQREITNILSGYKNIVESFRKPGIAGSTRSINGDEALRSLFASIKLAFEMMENALVWKELEKIPTTIKLTYANYDNKIWKIKDDFTTQDKRGLFKQVFWQRIYDKAFTFSYSYFEELVPRRDVLNFINRVGFISQNSQIIVSNGSLQEIAEAFKVKADPSTKITAKGAGTMPALKDLTVEECTPGQNLQLLLFHQCRNLAAHRLHSFEEMRREAIAILLIFARTLTGNQGSPVEYKEFACDQFRGDSFPIIHPCQKRGNIGDYLRHLMREVCYFGGKTIYKEMYELCKDPH